MSLSKEGADAPAERPNGGQGFRPCAGCEEATVELPALYCQAKACQRLEALEEPVSVPTPLSQDTRGLPALVVRSDSLTFIAQGESTTVPLATLAARARNGDALGGVLPLLLFGVTLKLTDLETTLAALLDRPTQASSVDDAMAQVERLVPKMLERFGVAPHQAGVPGGPVRMEPAEPEPGPSSKTGE